jgi:hypothetical protein
MHEGGRNAHRRTSLAYKFHDLSQQDESVATIPVNGKNCAAFHDIWFRSQIAELQRHQLADIAASSRISRS